MSIKDLNPAEPGSDALAGLGDDELRALKAALQNVFANVEGPITNDTGDGDSEDTGNWNSNPPNAATFSGLFNRVAFIEAVVGGAATIPLGIIVMWGGLEEDIPAGWALCDGTGGTPNLVDRFIVGAAKGQTGLFNIGSSGGNSWKSGGNNGFLDTQQGGGGTTEAQIVIPDHVLVESNLPAHEHAVFTETFNSVNEQSSDVGVSEYVSAGHDVDSTNDYRMKKAIGTEVPNRGKTGPYGSPGGSPDPLTHPPQDIEITGITHNHDYSPHYYALAYIQFVGE